MNTNQLTARILWAMAILSIFALIFVSIARAQEWHVTNQATVTWDAVTTLEDGSPVTGVITYKVWRKRAGTEDEEMIADGISGLSYVMTFAIEGSYFVGVSAVRTIDGQAIESSIAWSNDPAATNGNPFGIRHYVPPAVPTGLSQQ